MLRRSLPLKRSSTGVVVLLLPQLCKAQKGPYCMLVPSCQAGPSRLPLYVCEQWVLICAPLITNETYELHTHCFVLKAPFRVISFIQRGPSSNPTYTNEEWVFYRSRLAFTSF